MSNDEDRNYKRLYLNVFHKEQFLYLIMPAYSRVDPDAYRLRLSATGQPLKRKRIIRRHAHEAVQVAIFEFNPERDENQVCIDYEGFRTELTLSRERQFSSRQNLALTTLFKQDAALIDPFYEYYVQQGVEQFFLYYNGRLSDEIRSLFDRPGILLLEWDYRYWNDEECSWPHHAQPAQMNDALYRFGKGNYQYMAFCDFDEYLHIPGTTLGQFVAGHHYDKLGFCCCWASSPWAKSLAELPDQVGLGDPAKYAWRSKCILNTDSVELVGVHDSPVVNAEPKTRKDLRMLHFADWNQAKRQRETPHVHVWKSGSTIL